MARGGVGAIGTALRGRAPWPGLGAPAEAGQPPGPPGSDWSWRPRPWRAALAGCPVVAGGPRTAVDDGLAIFHDGHDVAVALRQVPNPAGADAPFALGLDVARFDGSYLSLALDLPPGAARGLRQRHLVRLDLRWTAEPLVTLFARLNLRHGPNTESLVQAFPAGRPASVVEFDLASATLDERRVGATWIDLILEAPPPGYVALHDLTLSRAPRAEM